MAIEMNSLDDRKFDDLVEEAQRRLAHHIPEMAQLTQGDPLFALVDLFAWMTESVIYRANLIPERQRRAFLSLLQLPMRPAIAATGILCIDTKIGRGAGLAPLLEHHTQLSAGDQKLSTIGELQSIPLAMAIMIKERIAPELLDQLAISPEQLHSLYHTQVQAFRPKRFDMEQDQLSLSNSLDQSFYLLCYFPKTKQLAQKAQLLAEMAASIINIGVIPQRDIDAKQATKLAPRVLRWEMAWQVSAEQNHCRYLPLEIVADSSKGGRVKGVVRLRLPATSAVFDSQFNTDPQYAGFDNTPPQTPDDISDPRQVAFWIRVSAPQENDFELDYLGLNAVDVVAQGIVRDQMIALGSGQSNQQYLLAQSQIDAQSLVIEVSEFSHFYAWQQVSDFNGYSESDRVYSFDPINSQITFGDGLRGMRPPLKSRIRARYYQYGGGKASNLMAASANALHDVPNKYQIRHERALTGGLDAETIAQAQARIPTYLNHRNRAVTRSDFINLALQNPLNPVARAELISGFLPATSINSIQRNVPGVVSIFVLPPNPIAMGVIKRPTAGLLRDVYQYLDERTLLGTELYVLSPEFIPVALSVVVEVLDPQLQVQTLNGVNQSLLEYLWLTAPGGPSGNGWPLGRALEVNELKAVAARVDGVLAVSDLVIYEQRSSSNTWAKMDSIKLSDYQLPEVMQVHSQQGDSQSKAQMPPMIDPNETETGASVAVAVPVIPDIC